MVEGFLLDGIDAEATGAAIRGENDLSALARSHKTQPTLTIAQAALPGTQVALDATIVQPVPVPGGYDGTHRILHGNRLAQRSTTTNVTR